MESSTSYLVAKTVKEVEEIREILKACQETREKQDKESSEIEERARQIFLAHHPESKSSIYKDLFIVFGIPLIVVTAIGAISYYVLS
jgi:hypothetical protein